MKIFKNFFGENPKNLPIKNLMNLISIKIRVRKMDYLVIAKIVRNNIEKIT